MRFDSLAQRFSSAFASRRKSARRPARHALAARRSYLESLEARMVLTTFYVDASLFLSADRDSSGGLTAGDQVTFGHGQTYEQANLTYAAAPAAGDAGTAFSSIGQALASSLVQAGDTIDVAGGTYSTSGLYINKSVTLQGLGDVVLSYAPPQPIQAIGVPFVASTITPLSGSVGIAIRGNPSSVTLANLDIEGFSSSLYCDGCGTLNLTDLTLNSAQSGIVPLSLNSVLPPQPYLPGVSWI